MIDAINVQTVTFTIEDGAGDPVLGWPRDYNGQNVTINVKPVYWDDAVDVSLSGKKRSNIRGFDLSVSLNFNASLQPDEMEILLEGLINLQDPEYTLKMTFDDVQYFPLYPTDGVNILIEYRDTVRTGGPSAVIPTLEFEGTEYFTNLSLFLSP